MSAKDVSQDAQNLAHFACDHCRRKKLKCSRELPKCSACRPWPSSCDYIRDAASSTPRKIRRTNHASVFSRVSLGEGADREDEKPRDVASAPPSDQLRPYSSFSFLNQAVSDLSRHSGTSGSRSHDEAQAEIDKLRAVIEMDGKVEQNFAKPMGTFIIPSRSAGYANISKFLAASAMGRLFFEEPSDDCLRQVLFEPAKVKQKAWVVFINYMLLGMVSTDPDKTDQARRFRSNMQLALNDVRIFLNPSLINVQTLAVLAIHGEDFASPTQSWMLVGHACRQAEALALHIPAGVSKSERQRRICLFWLLFIIDKGCSLAFGRSPALPSSVYHEVPLPDYDYLAHNSPHTSSETGAGSISQISHFGARFYLRGFGLCKLIGCILEAKLGAGPHQQVDQLRERLEEWWRITNTELSRAIAEETPSTDPSQQREMSLGIRSFKFQYLHLLIILLRGDKARSALRIASAREALSILPAMVSNWGSVYNGIVWQLLYLPFGPFFVIFDHIATDPVTWTVERDLQLLNTTVTYFESMQMQLSLLSTLAARLARTAKVFVQLAQRCISASMQKSAVDEQTGRDVDLEDIENYLQWLPADVVGAMPPINSMEHSGPSACGTNAQAETTETARQLDEFFDWFSWESYYNDGQQ